MHYGCIAGLVLMLVIVLGGLFGLHLAKKMFNNFTDDKPMALPQSQMSQADFDKLELRLDNFRQAVRAAQPVEPLALSADEINALIARDPDFSTVKGKLYVMLSEDNIKGQLSLPMESVGLPLFKGRYLNGTGTFSISLHNGFLRLTTLSFIVKGKAVPEVYMQQIRKHNLAENANSEPRVSAALEKLKGIKVQNGKLLVAPK